MSYQSHSYREDLLHRADEERKRRREDSISYSPTAVVQMEKEQAEVDRLAASTKAYKALDAVKDELEQAKAQLVMIKLDVEEFLEVHQYVK